MWDSIHEIFSSDGFMPHIHCYLAKPALVWTMFTTDLLIGIAYVGISITLWGLIRKINIPFSFVVLCFGVFIGACGTTHFMEVLTLWQPVYWASAFVKVLTAIASVGTGIYLVRLRKPLIEVAEAAKLSEQRRLDLEVLTNTLEQRVEERTKELNQALKIRDDFLSVASHEFRTPITALRLKSEINRRQLAKEDSVTAARFSKFTKEFDGQITRLAKLVEDLLDLSRARAGQLSLTPEHFNLSELVLQAVDKMSFALTDAKIDLSTSISPELKVFGDPMRIEQVILNIVTNAIRYAPGTPLSVGLKKSIDHIELDFKDGGPGIATKDAERVFNRFERLEAKNHVQGMGVGLFITQAIIRAHRGTVESVPSEIGAHFVIKLPLESGLKSLDSTISVSDNQ